MRLKAGTKRASSDATTTSAAKARLTPAPAATPLTAATTGFGKVADRLDQGVVLGAEDRPEVALGGPAAQVGPGAEPAARAGDHDGANGLVAGDGLESGQQLAAELARSAHSGPPAGSA